MEFLVRIWQTYPILLDFTLYFLVFGAAARVGFAKSFPSHEGKVLAVAVGLFLAASLAIAQRKLGFSLERMGPVAASILCGVVLVAAYRFMQHAEVPKALTVLLAGLMALALARAVMPSATARFLRENPVVIGIGLLGIVYWAWHSSQGYLDRIQNKRPGKLLGKHHIVPDEGLLRKEARFAKKRVKSTTRKDRKEEKTIASDLDEASGLLEKGKDDGENHSRVIRLLDKALEKANHVHKNCEKLLWLDNALRRYDWRWLKKAHALDLSDLTPEQHTLVKDSILAERRRIGTEEYLEKLQTEVNGHIQAMTEYVRRAKTSTTDRSAAGAVGWLSKALEEERKVEDTESKIMDWEKRLIRLVKKQLAEMERAG